MNRGFIPNIAIDMQSSLLQPIDHPAYDEAGVKVWMFLDYKVNPLLSGNKWRKMEYNLKEVKEQSFKEIITLGGAYSNHLYAFANACEMEGFKGIALVRGDSFDENNPTLQQLKQKNIQIHFIDRALYRDKDLLEKTYRSLYPNAYWLPEGGTNEKAVLGFEQLVQKITSLQTNYDYLVCPVGTGGTLAGVSKYNEARSLGMVVVKDNSVEQKIHQLNGHKSVEINMDYTFGGYAKWNDELLMFIHSFYEQYGIPLDPIYTGKMMFGLHNVIQKQTFKRDSVIIAIHTGGLQGLRGFVSRNGNRNFLDELMKDKYVNY